MSSIKNTTQHLPVKAKHSLAVLYMRSSVLLCILLLNSALFLNAQTTVTATLTADSTHIVIGDHFNVKLTIKHPASVKITLPVVKDTVGNMDFISASKTDTVNEPTVQTLSKTYTVSAFDSGQFHAGPLPILFKNSNGVTDTLLSNYIVVDATTLPVDTARPFKPIKGPLAVPYTLKEFLPYILAALLLICSIIAGFFLYKKYMKQKPVVTGRPVPKEPAHIWARKELKKLEEEKLWQKDEVKLYYSRLTEILRLYLEYRFSWLALESTTEEIEAAIDNYKMKEKAKDNLLQILRTADLVKFAKMLPAPESNIKAMETAYKFIEFTEPREEEVKKD